MWTTRSISLSLSIVAVVAITGEISAQNYPTRVIRIHTAGAGGSPDFAARLIANEIGAPLGQPVVVENRPPGAPLGLGVAKSAPDGYTLLVWGGAFWISTLFEDMPYDPVRDFTPITLLSRSPNILVVHPALPVRSVADLIKLAKSRPGQLNYSTGTTGGSSHVAGELFKSMANADIVRVPYKGSSTELADLLSGEVQMTFASGASMAAHIKAGKMRALAVTSPKRSAIFPELPAVAEALPGYEMEQVVGFYAPAKTPEAVIRLLNLETVRALEKPEVRERLRGNGVEAAGGTPEQLGNMMKAEIGRLSKIARNIGIKR